MKKIFFSLIGIGLILGVATGCSNNTEKELCDKIDEIDVQSFTNESKYENLATILEDNFEEYCQNSNSEVCKKLSEYITSTKAEINLKDCNKVDSTFKDLCESNNKLAILDKQNNVNYMHEEMWAVCNK